MTLEDLICMKCIFEGYETDICDQTEEEFDEFYTANKFRTVINFGAVLDRNGLPAVNILVYA